MCKATAKPLDVTRIVVCLMLQNGRRKREEKNQRRKCKGEIKNNHRQRNGFNFSCLQ